MERTEHSPDHVRGSFSKIVVGIDEHQGGRDAMALATQLLAADGTVTPANVVAVDPVISSRLRAAFNREHQRASDAQLAAEEPLAIEAPLRVEAPSVGRGLHELADAEQADLLVIGSCRRGLVGRVMLGDDTSDALNGTSCAIAIAPFGYADQPAVMGEVGVAYDGSPESDEALALARALASEHRARLSAFQAVAVPAYLSVPGPGAGAVMESVPQLVDEAQARLAALGGVEPHAAYGQPAEELAVYSASLSLLVIGSRGYGPVGRLVHGSTSRRLARTARCPLLVLTRGAGVRPSLPAGAEHPQVPAAVV